MSTCEDGTTKYADLDSVDNTETTILLYLVGVAKMCYTIPLPVTLFPPSLFALLFQTKNHTQSLHTKAV